MKADQGSVNFALVAADICNSKLLWWPIFVAAPILKSWAQLSMFHIKEAIQKGEVKRLCSVSKTLTVNTDTDTDTVIMGDSLLFM